MKNELQFKDDLILSYCKNKRVLHIGATDYPFHLEKARNKELLHQKLSEISDVTGLDISDKAIKDLRRIGITNIKKKDITRPFEKNYKNKYGVIVLGDVIEHLANPGLALKNLKNIMDKNTKLIITTPNCYSYVNVANIFRSKEDVHPDHFFWPSYQTMKQLFTSHGLKIEKFCYVNIGSYNDIKTLKGRIFSRTVLKNIKKLRGTLFFVLRKE